MSQLVSGHKSKWYGLSFKKVKKMKPFACFLVLRGTRLPALSGACGGVGSWEGVALPVYTYWRWWWWEYREVASTGCTDNWGELLLMSTYICFQKRTFWKYSCKTSTKNELRTNICWVYSKCPLSLARPQLVKLKWLAEYAAVRTGISFGQRGKTLLLFYIVAQMCDSGKQGGFNFITEYYL